MKSDPGKYDAECTMARLATGAQGVLLMVLHGTKGSGFAVQVPPEYVDEIPDMLENLAAHIRASAKRLSGPAP